MNGQRITIGLILFILAAACLVQTTFTGCSNSETGVGGIDDGDSGSSAVFIDESNSGVDLLEAVWEPVTDGVMDQLEDMYNGSGMAFVSIDQDVNASRSMRCVLESRDEFSVRKQLLDGMWVFYNTFPGQKMYHVELTSGDSLQVCWDTLGKMADMGYSHEMSENDLNDVWFVVESDGAPAARKASGGLTIQSN